MLLLCKYGPALANVFSWSYFVRWPEHIISVAYCPWLFHFRGLLFLGCIKNNENKYSSVRYNYRDQIYNNNCIVCLLSCKGPYVTSVIMIVLSVEEEAFEVASLLIILRLWRILRIVNGKCMCVHQVT